MALLSADQMDEIKLIVDIGQFVLAVVSAFLVAGYWNRVNHRSEQYRYLDQTYNDILKTYLEDPEFGQKALTDDYERKFHNSKAWRYHYFAMRVHTFLESIFDLSEDGKILDVWAHIFEHHAKLHAAWLRDHKDIQEQGYIEVCNRLRVWDTLGAATNQNAKP